MHGDDGGRRGALTRLLACLGGLWWTYVDPEILLKSGRPRALESWSQLSLDSCPASTMGRCQTLPGRSLAAQRPHAAAHYLSLTSIPPGHLLDGQVVNVAVDPYGSDGRHRDGLHDLRISARFPGYDL